MPQLHLTALRGSETYLPLLHNTLADEEPLWDVRKLTTQLEEKDAFGFTPIQVHG